MQEFNWIGLEQIACELLGDTFVEVNWMCRKGVAQHNKRPDMLTCCGKRWARFLKISGLCGKVDELISTISFLFGILQTFSVCACTYYANILTPYFSLKLLFQTRRSRGYCFVYFESIKGAIEAVEASTDLRIHSRYVRVDFSITNRPRSPITHRHKYEYSRSSRYSRDRSRSPCKYYRSRSQCYF